MDLKTLPCVQAEFVGSRVTCSPPPADTDLDVLVLDEFYDPQKWEDLGFTIESPHNPDYGPDVLFTSYRRGDINLIVTDEHDFYELFLVATRLCKSLNLMQKQNRVTLFKFILYNELPRRTVRDAVENPFV